MIKLKQEKDFFAQLLTNHLFGVNRNLSGKSTLSTKDTVLSVGGKKKNKKTLIMSGFFWNVQGFNKKEKHSVVKRWIREQGFQFGALLETRVKEVRCQRISTSVFGDGSMLTNYEYNQLGRIWLVWRFDVRVTPVFKSDQLITVSMVLSGGGDFFLSVIYAKNTEVERHVLWEDLKNHQNSPIFRN